MWLCRILPSFISRHRQMAPLTLHSNVFLLIFLTQCSELNSLLHSSLWGEDSSTVPIVFASGTQNYLSLICGVLAWNSFGRRFFSTAKEEKRKKALNSYRRRPAKLFSFKRTEDGSNTLVLAAEGVWLLYVSQAIIKRF